MARTEAAVVGAVGSCLTARGVRRTTMVEIAAEAGIAKGTLYNHVRTKGEALSLYADAQVETLVGLLTGQPEAALRAAADAVAGHEVVRALAVAEPAALAAALLGPAATIRRERVGEALEDLLGQQSASLALRWLTSLLIDPGTSEQRAADARLLVVRA